MTSPTSIAKGYKELILNYGQVRSQNRSNELIGRQSEYSNPEFDSDLDNQSPNQFQSNTEKPCSKMKSPYDNSFSEEHALLQKSDSCPRRPAKYSSSRSKSFVRENDNSYDQTSEEGRGVVDCKNCGRDMPYDNSFSENNVQSQTSCRCQRKSSGHSSSKSKRSYQANDNLHDQSREEGKASVKQKKHIRNKSYDNSFPEKSVQPRTSGSGSSKQPQHSFSRNKSFVRENDNLHDQMMEEGEGFDEHKNYIRDKSFDNRLPEKSAPSQASGSCPSKQTRHSFPRSKQFVRENDNLHDQIMEEGEGFDEHKNYIRDKSFDNRLPEKSAPSQASGSCPSKQTRHSFPISKQFVRENDNFHDQMEEEGEGFDDHKNYIRYKSYDNSVPEKSTPSQTSASCPSKPFRNSSSKSKWPAKANDNSHDQSRKEGKSCGNRCDNSSSKESRQSQSSDNHQRGSSRKSNASYSDCNSRDSNINSYGLNKELYLKEQSEKRTKSICVQTDPVFDPDPSSNVGGLNETPLKEQLGVKYVSQSMNDDKNSSSEYKGLGRGRLLKILKERSLQPGGSSRKSDTVHGSKQPISNESLLPSEEVFNECTDVPPNVLSKSISNQTTPGDSDAEVKISIKNNVEPKQYSERPTSSEDRSCSSFEFKDQYDDYDITDMKQCKKNYSITSEVNLLQRPASLLLNKTHLDQDSYSDSSLVDLTERMKLAGGIIHGTKQSYPASNISDLNLSPLIFSNLRKNKILDLSRSQMFACPILLQRRNLIFVGPPESGKTVGCLISIMSLLMDNEYYSEIPAGNGPMCVFLCSSSESADRISYVCTKLVSDSCLRIVTTSGGNILSERINDLTNGCDVLITNPRCWLRLLNYKTVTNMKRLCHIVFDNVEILFDKFFQQVREILNRAKTTLHFRQSKHNVGIQVVFVSRKWTPTLESSLKIIDSPVLGFTSHIEAALYAKIKPVTIVCKCGESKVDKLKDLLLNTPSKGTVVVCNNADEVKRLQPILEQLFKNILVAHEKLFDGTHLQSLCEISSRWAHSRSPPILLCSDSVLGELAVTDANHLIHFNLSENKSSFSERFATLMQHFPDRVMHPDSEPPDCRVHILIEATNKRQFPEIVGLMERLGTPIPEEILTFVKEIRSEQEQKKLNKPLCENMLLFGSCYQMERCKNRHSFNKDLDDRNVPTPLPKSGVLKLQLFNVHNPAHYSVRITEVKLDGSDKWEPWKNNYVGVMLKMSNYFSSRKNRVPHGEVNIGDIVAVEEESDIVFRRAVVLDIISRDARNDPARVKILLLDSGVTLRKKVGELLHLPEKLKQYPRESYDLYLTGLQPIDFDPEWSYVSYKTLKDKLEAVTEKSNDHFFSAKVLFSFGTTLIVSSFLCCEWLESCKCYVTLFSPKTFLIDAGLAEPNNNHVKALSDLAASAGIVSSCATDIKEEDKYNNAEEIQWAHLENDDNYFPTAVVDSVDPSLFYIRAEKFSDSLCSLQKELTELLNKKVIKPDFLKNGMICAVREPVEDEWNRAILLEVVDDEAEVFCVDYGDTIKVCLSDVSLLPPGFTSRLPFQAIECSLAGITLYPERLEKAIECFDSLSRNPDNTLKNLYAKVHEVKEKADTTDGRHYHIILVDASQNPEICLNFELVYRHVANWDFSMPLDNYSFSLPPTNESRDEFQEDEGNDLKDVESAILSDSENDVRKEENRDTESQSDDESNNTVSTILPRKDTRDTSKDYQFNWLLQQFSERDFDFEFDPVSLFQKLFCPPESSEIASPTSLNTEMASTNCDNDIPKLDWIEESLKSDRSTSESNYNECVERVENKSHSASFCASEEERISYNDKIQTQCKITHCCNNECVKSMESESHDSSLCVSEDERISSNENIQTQFENTPHSNNECAKSESHDSSLCVSEDERISSNDNIQTQCEGTPHCNIECVESIESVLHVSSICVSEGERNSNNKNIQAQGANTPQTNNECVESSGSESHVSSLCKSEEGKNSNNENIQIQGVNTPRCGNECVKSESHDSSICMSEEERVSSHDNIQTQCDGTPHSNNECVENIESESHVSSLCVSEEERNSNNGNIQTQGANTLRSNNEHIKCLESESHNSSYVTEKDKTSFTEGIQTECESAPLIKVFEGIIIPNVLWSQTSCFIKMKVLVPGITVYDIDIKDSQICFKAHVNDKYYFFDLDFFGNVYPKSANCSPGGLCFEIKLEKVLKGEKWPRFTFKDRKYPWLKPDPEYIVTKSNKYIPAGFKIEKKSRIQDMWRKRLGGESRIGPDDDSDSETEESNSSIYHDLDEED